MSRVCDVTGRKPMYGNNVSHAHNKSRRRFDINLQKKRFWLSDEKRWITLKVSTQGLRLIDKIGIRKVVNRICLLYTSPSPRDRTRSRMPSSA